MKLTAVLFGFATLAAIPAHAEWTQRVRMDTPERIYDAVWDGTRFIAVGGFGTVRTSTDGVHWADQSVQGNPNLKSIATDGRGLSVAMDDQLFTWTTTDGVSWARSPNPQGTGEKTLQWTGARFVLSQTYTNGVSPSTLASLDGLSWVPDSTLGSGCDSAVVTEAGLELRVMTHAYTRTPGHQWQVCSTGTTKTMNVAVRGQGLWVLGGDSGKILTSPDAKSWTTTTIGSGIPGIQNLAYARGLWIAIATISDSFVVYTSPDASVWTRKLRFPNKSGLNYNASFKSVIICDSTRWAVLENDEVGQIAVSTDGATWKLDTVPGDGPFRTATNDLVSQTSVSNGQGILVVRGNGILAWRQGTSPWVRSDSTPRSKLIGVAHHDGIWIAAGVQGDSSIVWRSTDGIEWTPARIRFKGSYQNFPRGVFAARGVFIVSGVESTDPFSSNVGSTLVSEDGITWIDAGDCQVAKLADNGRSLVSASTSAMEVCSSEDGRTWTRRKTHAANNGFWDLHWSNDRFVAFGAGATLWSSFDGINWTVADFKSDNPGNIMQLGWNGTIWCLRGTSGTYLSTDADQWVRATSGVDNYTIGTTWKGAFVAENPNFGRVESIESSSDGKVWVSDTISKDPGVYLAGFHDLGDTLYAMTNKRFLERTSDLKTWETEYFTSNAILAMAHADGLLVAVGENSNIWTRPTTAVDVGIRPRVVRHATQFLLTGRTLRIPGGASLSADLVDLRGRVVARATPRGEDLVMDLRGAGSGIAAVRVRDLGHLETRMLVLP